MAEHTADTEQFPWSQYAPLTYRRFQLRNNFFIRNKNSGPEPVPYLEFLLYWTASAMLPWQLLGFTRAMRR